MRELEIFNLEKKAVLKDLCTYLESHPNKEIFNFFFFFDRISTEKMYNQQMMVTERKFRVKCYLKLGRDFPDSLVVKILSFQGWRV